MPVHKGKDSRGEYWQWGEHGHRYYGPEGRAKAERQARAAYANGFREKKKKIGGKK